ncbi:transporter substrate-binding domain-containing protein [Niallia sp. 03133]|uniref:transporter substrate-binding domain-containing protein n=1 Tax=Niallia sp. 03133 TaxID=3458060 RepID=UPI004043DE90
MKRILLTMMTILGVFLLVACGSKSESEPKESSSADSEKVYSGKTFKIALSPNFAPFESAELNDKGETEVVGFDMDLIDQLSKDLGFKYEIVETEFNGLIGELQSGRADLVISGMTATDERRKSIDFSEPYFFTKTAVMFPKDSPISSASKMKGKKIVATFGTNYEQQAKNMGAKVTSLDTGALAIQELFSGRVDGAMMDATKAAIESGKKPDYSYFIFSDKELGIKGSNSFNIAFPKGSDLQDEFNKYIKQYQEDGTIDKLMKKWMGEKFVEESKAKSN